MQNVKVVIQHAQQQQQQVVVVAAADHAEKNVVVHVHSDVLTYVVQTRVIKDVKKDVMMDVMAHVKQHARELLKHQRKLVTSVAVLVIRHVQRSAQEHVAELAE